MLVTSKQFEEYKKEKELELDILRKQIEQFHEIFQHMSNRIDDIQEDIKPPLVMGGK